MTMQERIVARLTQALEPQQLAIVDESDRHAGHAGVRTGPRSCGWRSAARIIG